MAYTTIDKPSDYLRIQTWSGNNSADREITWSETDNMQPDWIWVKRRSDTANHRLADSVRGATKILRSDTDGAETTESDDTLSFDTNGFSVGNNSGVNKTGDTYVGWGWKAGTSVSGNTGGSGTAKTYTGSVNTDARFSIIRYIGNSTAGHTIPHHLGTTPAWIICRTISAAKEWDVYHHKLASSPESDYIVLNTNAAAAGATDAADKWNDTAPTSSVVTLGDSSQLNTNDGTCIMYAFAEKQGYSKFGSYTGNGNANGTFVYTGQKSAFIMVKNTTRAASWLMFDNKRLGYNVDNNEVVANTSAAEETYDQLDFLSNGFKMRTNGTSINLNGDTYIYMCFADNPFTTSTGVPATAR